MILWLLNRATKFKEISKTVSLFFLLRPNYKSFSSDSYCIVFLVILSISSKNLVNFWARKHLRFEFQTCLLSFLRPGPLVSLSFSSSSLFPFTVASKLLFCPGVMCPAALLTNLMSQRALAIKVARMIAAGPYDPSRKPIILCPEDNIF